MQSDNFQARAPQGDSKTDSRRVLQLPVLPDPLEASIPETGFERLRQFVLRQCIEPGAFDEVLRLFPRPLRAQTQWFKEIYFGALRNAPEKDFDFASLDKVSESKDPSKLAAIVFLFDPEKVEREFGLEFLIWSWINRDGATPSAIPKEYQQVADHLTRKGVDVALLDVLVGSVRATPISAAAIYRDYQQFLARREQCVEVQAGPHTVYRWLLDIYDSYWRQNQVPQHEKAPIITALARCNHLPHSLRIRDLEHLSVYGNPKQFHYLVTSLPFESLSNSSLTAGASELIDLFQGQRDQETALGVLAWAAANFTSVQSPRHHIFFEDSRFRSLMKFLKNNFEVDTEDFRRAQHMTWGHSTGSRDLEIIVGNYYLLLAHGQLSPSSFPLVDIMRRNAIGRFKEKKVKANYGVSILRLKSGDITGVAMNWKRKQILMKLPEGEYVIKDVRLKKADGELVMRDLRERVTLPAGILAREFENVMPETKVALALTHIEDYVDAQTDKRRYTYTPICLVSLRIHRGPDGKPQGFIQQLQGIQQEYRELDGSVHYVRGTHRALWSNWRSVGAAMGVYTMERKTLPYSWAIACGANSAWRDKVEEIRSYDDPIRTMQVNGATLSPNAWGDFEPMR